MPKTPKPLKSIAARIEQTRLNIGDSPEAMAERIGLSDKSYRAIHAGKEPTEKELPQLARWFEMSEAEVLKLHTTEITESVKPSTRAPTPVPKTTPEKTKPKNQRGYTTLVPQTALGQLLEDTRKAQESIIGVEAWAYRLDLTTAGNYYKMAKGDLTETAQERLFKRLEETLPKYLGKKIDAAELRELYTAPAAQRELTLHGAPETPNKKR